MIRRTDTMGENCGGEGGREGKRGGGREVSEEIRLPSNRCAAELSRSATA